MLALDLGTEFYHPDVLRPESQEGFHSPGEGGKDCLSGSLNLLL